MADEKDFRAEYSKSNRAGCKACKVNIEKDVLRLAIMVQSPRFDGKQPSWFHFDCFWGRAKPSDVSQFSGIDNLRWEDQQKIKDYLSGKRGTTSGSKKSKGGSGGGDTLNYQDYCTEYAKTGKSKCRSCEDFIPKGEVRVSKKDYTSYRAAAYGPMDAWYHVDCFIKDRDELDFGTDKDITKIDMFPCLKPEDKKILIEKFGKPIATATKRKADGATGDKPSKTAKTEDRSEEKALKKQNEVFWKCRDTLEKLISKDAMKGLLEYNEQEVPSGDQNLLNCLADCMTFGALKKCPECKEGQLVFHSTGYSCHGDITEWTKCQYKTKNPKRGTFKVPKEYFDVEYLKNYKCKVQTRLFSKDGPATSGAAATALNETKQVANKDKPLQGMKFVIIGKVSDKKQLTKDVMKLGGEVVSKMDPNVSACFSTKAEVDADSKKIQEARGMNIRVLDENFLKEVKEGEFQEMLKKHCLSAWGETIVPKKSAQQMKSVARDAAVFTKSIPATMKMTVKGGSAVDPESGLEEGHHVLKEGKSLYSEVLNMVDVMKGTNSYYKLQLLESDSGGSSYHLFRSWGRVGTTIGGTKIERFYAKEKAKENFKSLYAEKTGNEWENRSNFKKYPHKFYPIEMDYEHDDAKIANLNEAGGKSKLAKPIQEIIKMIFDIENMKKAMIEFEIDLKKMPLGKLSKKQVEKAYSVLTEVQDLLKHGGSATKFLDCSNRFYTLIPHDFGMEKPTLLDNEAILKAKTAMLDSLLEIEVAYSLLKTSDGTDKDPIDQHYEQLKTDIEVLDKSSDEYKRLVKFVENTHGATHDFKMEVEEIFTIKRYKESARYKPFKKLHNRMLLWHGSRTTNYAGIFSQGLRIAPPEAPVTGYMFGKGVYFADMASKSANYCRTTRSNPTGLMLLCEVALGKMYERQRAEMISKLPDGCHSTKGIGRTEPDPNEYYTSPEGVIYPMGKGKDSGPKTSSLLYNEYIVYDTAQINMKYMLKMSIKPAY